MGVTKGKVEKEEAGCSVKERHKILCCSPGICVLKLEEVESGAGIGSPPLSAWRRAEEAKDE